MKVRKAIAIMLVLAAAMASVFAGGASEDAAPAQNRVYEGVTLNMWSMWNSAEPQGQVLQQAADAFYEETGCRVNIEFKGRDISQIIMTALQSGESVDLFEEDYRRIATSYNDYVLNLDEMAAAADYASVSYPVFNETQIGWTGHLTSITEQPQVGGIFYNKAIFEECGITEIPETWDEFMDMCQVLVDNDYAPMALDSTYTNFNMGYHLDRYIGQEKTAEFAMNGGWSDEPGVIQAGEDIIAFVEAGYLAEGAPDEYPNGQNKLGFDNAVMVVCAQYVTTEVNGATGANIEWGLMNYPTVGGSSAAYAGANSIAISSACANPQAAFDFALFLTTGEWDQAMADAVPQIPADPRNTCTSLEGAVETLMAASSPLEWAGGTTANSNLTPMIKDVCIQIFEGRFATGEEFAQALDALYR